MKRRLSVLAVLVAGGVMASTAMAKEGAAASSVKPTVTPAVKHAAEPAPAVEKITFTGKLGKAQETKKDKDGKDVTSSYFTVTLDDATIVRLPHGKVHQADGKVTDLETLVGKQVTVSGEGQTGEKNGKKWFKVVKVDSVSEVLPPPPPPPAAK